MGTKKLVGVKISIGELFNRLGIDNDNYEKLQTPDYKIYIKNVYGDIVPILGYVKKRVNLVKYTFTDNNNNELNLICSDKHILLDKDGNNTLAKNTDTCQSMYNGVLIKKTAVLLGEGDAYDIAISEPHLYYTTNGIIHHNTSLSRIMAKFGAEPLFINASLERGIDTIRDKVSEYASVNSLFDGEDLLKVVVLEECDNLTNDAWASLRATIEQFSSTVRFIANCNYIDKVPDPIKSRFNCIPIEPINKEEEEYLFSEYCKRVTLIMNACQIKNEPENVQKFVTAYFPDMRTIIKKIQQLYTRQVTELTPESVGITFDCSEIFNIIMNGNNPIENYKQLVSSWGNKADDAILMIGKQFPDYMAVVCPDKLNKLPQVILAIAEYQAQLPHAIDKFVVLAALVYRLQIIMHS